MKKSKKWEGSKADKAIDKKMAKKRGISLKKWEGSKEDEKVDSEAMKRYSKQKKQGM